MLLFEGVFAIAPCGALLLRGGVIGEANCSGGGVALPLRTPGGVIGDTDKSEGVISGPLRGGTSVVIAARGDQLYKDDTADNLCDLLILAL